MSKVICDVCGTTYPETASQCPICGSAKNSAAQTVAGENKSADSSGYAYVKGGRFSKKNVRRRNSRGDAALPVQRRSSTNTRSVKESDEPNNTGLIIVVILLVLAILSVVVYIWFAHFGPNNDKPEDTKPSGSTQGTQQTTDTTPSSDPVEIPCTSLQLSNDVLELAVGETWTLVAKAMPEDTTDSVVFASENPEIATVSDAGEITMVSEGETVITVTCGDQSATCTVKTPVDEPIIGTFEFAWNTIYVDDKGNGDTTLSAYGATWKAYKSGLTVSVDDITWTTDDPTIATIERGIVTAVGSGNTKVHATYNGVTYTCIIRCSFKMPDVIPTCKISATDVSISIGESFVLKLRDAEGASLVVTWTCEGDGVTIDGNKITGAAVGTYYVSTTYDGATYTCIVRVHE